MSIAYMAAITPSARLNRKGRKRKSGRRFASGDLARQVDACGVAMAQPHRFYLPVEKRRDQRAEHPLGSLNLTGTISREQYDAGMEFARIVSAYRASIGAPSLFPRSIRMEGVLAGGTANEIDADEAERRKSRYDRAFCAVSKAGRSCMLAVSRTAVHGEPCPSDRIGALKFGLDALANHFCLTNKKKSGRVGK